MIGISIPFEKHVAYMQANTISNIHIETARCKTHD